MFILGIFINLVGIFYLIFVLKEVKPKKKDTDGVDNPAFEKSKGDGTDNQNSNGRQKLKMDEPAKPKSCLLDFFNPIVAVECAKLIVKVREFNARRTVILLLVLYFIVQFTAGKTFFVVIMIRTFRGFICPVINVSHFLQTHHRFSASTI